MNDVTFSVIDFHRDKICVTTIPPNGPHVLIKPISDGLGLDWRAQQHRIQRDAILSEGVSIMDTLIVGNGQQLTWLRLDLLPGWLFGIDERRVKEEHRERVLTYKRECYTVLHEHFFLAKSDGHRPAVPIESDGLPLPEEARMRRINTAIRCFGARAGAELWALYGMELTPSMKACLSQKQFSFVDATVIDDPIEQDEE